LLEEAFDVWYPKLEERLKKIPSLTGKAATVKRSDREILEEVLDVVRGIGMPRIGVTSDKRRSYQVMVPIDKDWDDKQTQDLMVRLTRDIPLLVGASDVPPSSVADRFRVRR
jgi:hypothetical protein